MDITLVVPSFNRIDFLKRALNSAINQTYPPKEIIVVDDGSSQDIKQATSCYKNISIISYKPNKGVSYARNIGIKQAKYEWIAFLDDDDQWDKDKLKEQVLFHQQNKNIKISQTQEIWIRDTKQVNQPKSLNKPSGNIFVKSLERCLITPSSVLIHKSIFEDIGIFDESLIVCEDYDLWLRIAIKYDIGLIDKELITKYGGHSDQLSYKYWGMDRFRIRALEKHIDNKTYEKEIKTVLEKKYNILINGATKRGNTELATTYQQKLNQLQGQNNENPNRHSRQHTPSATTSTSKFQ